MPPDKMCEKFRDTLLDLKKSTKELDSHSQNCSDCQELLATTTLIQGHGSFYSEKKYPSLKKAILCDFDQFFSPASVAPPSLFTYIFSFKWGLGSLAFAACLFLLVFNIPRKPLVGPKEPYYQHFREGKTLEVSLTQPLEMPEGSAYAVAPDGSRFDVEGKTLLHVQERGFDLTYGKLKATVQPSLTPFKGSTPHGEIEVLGTVFTCSVNEKDSVVQVVSGKVRVTPRGKAPQTLVDGNSVSMVYSSKPKEIPPDSSVIFNGSGSLHPNDD